MTDNYRDSTGTCLLSTLNLYLSFVCVCVCVYVCVCTCVYECVTGGRPVGGKMQEVCLSSSTCIRHSMFFPFRGEVSCVCMCVGVFVCVCQSRRSHWAADFQEPLQQKQALCVSCSHTPLSQDTHTHTHIHRPLAYSFSPCRFPQRLSLCLQLSRCF
ncbi:hypothetical protein AMECASPLE_011858, partial [Ameca splendens]